MKKTVIFIVICLFIVGCKTKTVSDDFKEIKYKIPEIFEYDDDYTFSRYYNYEENQVSCEVSFHASDKSIYKSMDEWFKGSFAFTLNDKVSDLKEIDVNGNKALMIEKKSGKSIDYYYGFESSKFYYLVNYNIYDFEDGDRSDLETNKCFTSREDIISTISVK